MMKKKLIKSSLQLLLFLTIILCIQGCGKDDSVNDVAIITGPNQEDVQKKITIENEIKAAEEAKKIIKERNKPSHFIIGTGSVQGVYYPIAGVICRLLNRHKKEHNIRCSVESTGGSIYNLKELREGNFDIVVAQSDWQYFAYNGLSTFEKYGANKDIRSIFALEADPLALVVNAASGIEQFDDLLGKKVSFGYTRSLQYRVIQGLLKLKNWDEETFKSLSRMSDGKQLAELCAGNLDAALFLSSSLNDHLKTLTQECKLDLVDINVPEVATLINETPYLRTGIIPKGRYFDSQHDTYSFGVGATFVASKDTSPKAVYNITKEIVENFKDFQSLHSSLSTLDKNELPYAGLSAPLHSGAIRYYKEAGLLKH